MNDAIIAGGFILSFIAIKFENKLSINKSVSAIFTGILCWTFYSSSELIRL